jgi:uncharacterized protein (TIGR03086 family)
MSTQSLAAACASTRAVLASVRPDQLDAPTPCASWTVRALISHFVSTPRWAATAVESGREVPAADVDDAAGDFLASYDEAVRAALDAFGTAGALEKTVKLSFGELPGGALLGIITMEQFTHGWDLARATGQRTDLDPELAGELLAQARATVTDAFRGPDGAAFFGPVAEPPPGAGPADQLAAFLGRSG